MGEAERFREERRERERKEWRRVRRKRRVNEVEVGRREEGGRRKSRCWCEAEQSRGEE